MYELHLVVNDRLIKTNTFYDSVADTQSDYPPESFDTWIDHGILKTHPKTKKDNRPTMKGRGKDGWCY